MYRLIFCQAKLPECPDAAPRFWITLILEKNEKYAFTGSWDYMVNQWEIDGLSFLRTIENIEFISSVTLDIDHKTLLVGYVHDSNIKRWRIPE